MLPQDRTPPPEPPRQYVVKSKQQPPPPARGTRVVQQRTRTPPPPPREAWHSGPRRQINSDTEIIDRQQRMRREETDYEEQPPIKPELYHIDAVIDYDRRTPSDSPTYMSQDNRTPTPPVVGYQGNGNRKQRRVEPLERKNPNEPEPVFVRRTYKKLPPGKYEPPNDEYIPNENQSRMVRNNDRTRPPPRQYSSTPQLQTRNNRSPETFRNPSNYHRSIDDY
jgi:hypothetical protein